MTTTPRHVFFDIFCGETDGDGKWVEDVEGLAAAVERMDVIAKEKPGMYFVFDRQNRKVVGACKFEKSLQTKCKRRQLEA